MPRSETLRRPKPLRKKKAAPEAAQQEDLNAASRALYGIGEGREAPSRRNESMEDPLGDWPRRAARRAARRVAPARSFYLGYKET
jgi:hypothetical protein